MPIPTASPEELAKVHRALRIAAPLETASPLIRATLAMVAHCWRGRVPANLWAGRETAGKPVRAMARPSSIDFKRRAAGDFE